ncbi:MULTISPECIES: YigZ family protein [unclassified Methanoculleus]|uniref:YigZ family protein n=1 Tax=unclassified Methanoculleus TaxID=2619537 RepID=UPI0025DEFB7E|nr:MULTISPECIES: YigZ family protein [unclassified Methanoculleus]
MTAEPLGTAAIEVRRSRFYAHLYRVEGPQDVAGVLAGHREAYRKAAHHCAALRCGTLEEFRNDGEVGRPGRVLLDLLRKHGLGSHALVVSRIFGGVLLGPGNVGRAFRDAGEAAIREAGVTR